MDHWSNFEEWYEEESKGWPYALKKSCKESMWNAWSASRKSLVVQLPAIIDKDWACTSSECEAMRHGITLTRHKINAIGVRVK